MSSSESVFARWLDPEKEIPEVDPAIKLLEWINKKWNKDTVSLRDICWRGPNFLQNDRESAFNAAKVLVQRGILVPLKPHRSDRRLWHIVREPVQK